jgi:ABC-type sugar transport system ATPase subunit
VSAAPTTQHPGRSAAPGDAPAIRLAGIVKRYGGTCALDGVDLEVGAGEVHALVGENGAGKSTCLGVLAGRVVPDDGETTLFGEAFAPGDPRGARRAGVATIYQELTIVPALSSQGNVFLGQDLSRSGLIREREMRERFTGLCEQIGVRVPADVPAGSLSIADQQVVEIMRALVGRPRVILFDEPTAALAAREREALYGVIRGLRADGVTIVFVSHNLDEVLDIADHVTVFRSGKLSASRPVGEWTKQELVRAMVGRDLERARGRTAAFAARLGEEPMLRVRGLTVRDELTDVSLDLRRGEVLGIGGLVGSGRSELLRAIAGDLPITSGELWMEGERLRWPGSVRRARAHGISLVPEDRAAAGILPELTAAENIVVSDLSSAARLGVVSKRRLAAAAGSAADGMHFPRERLGDLAGGLSGGNQQKLLLARAAHSRPRVLLADEPTRGVDVGAKAEIMRTIKELAASGMAVIVVSSELEDLELLCDRVLVLAGGRPAGEISRREAITVHSILELAFGVQEPS